MTPKPYTIKLTKQATKDIQKLTPKLQTKLKDILRNKIAVAPKTGKPLTGQMSGYYSVRLTVRDRIVYRIEHMECVVIIVRAKTHYGD
jgi:addiction module RelE/StbE family toxin